MRTDHSRAQHEAWHRYEQARRAAGMRPVREVRAVELQRGDVLAGGGTVTRVPSPHPSGQVAVEIDWQTLVAWEAERRVVVYERDGGR